MSRLRLTIAKSAYLDTLLVAAPLLLFNSLTRPSDIGWLSLNPSPYFLIPVLIGGRYGFLPGLASGIFTALLVFAGQTYSGHLRATLGPPPFIFSAFVLAGVVCGEIQHYFHRRLIQQEALNEHLRTRAKKLEADFYLLREAKSEMEQMVATRDADVFSLDAEIRQLYASSAEDVYQDVLRLLNRQLRITDAGLYRLMAGQQLERRALIGEAEFLPTRLKVDEVEMVSLAVQRRTAVTIPEFWRRQLEAHKDYLVTVPFLDFHDLPFAVLIVTGMPFIALNQKTVYLIQSICRLVSGILDLKMNSEGKYRTVGGIEHQRLFTREFFKHNVEATFESYRSHNLPSAVVFFMLPGVPRSFQTEFESLILQVVRAGDFPANLEMDFPNLAVLLPLTGERGANIFVERIVGHCAQNPVARQHLKYQLLTYDKAKDFASLWADFNERWKTNV